MRWSGSGRKGKGGGGKGKEKRYSWVGRPKIKSASEVVSSSNSKKGREKVETQHKPRNQRTAMAFDTRMATVTVTELRRAYRSDRSFRYILVFDFY